MVNETNEARMSESEILARSGFLSLVGKADFTVGRYVRPFSLP
jgi:hypothetical protein